MLRLTVQLPELRPEIVLERMERRVAGHDCAVERPFRRMLHQFCSQRIFQDVIADSDEGVPSPLFFLEHVVVRLLLEFLRREFGFKMRSQEGHAIELVGIRPQPHPNQVQMIGQKAVGRAE